MGESPYASPASVESNAQIPETPASSLDVELPLNQSRRDIISITIALVEPDSELVLFHESTAGNTDNFSSELWTERQTEPYMFSLVNSKANWMDSEPALAACWIMFPKCFKQQSSSMKVMLLYHHSEKLTTCFPSWNHSTKDSTDAPKSHHISILRDITMHLNNFRRDGRTPWQFKKCIESLNAFVLITNETFSNK